MYKTTVEPLLKGTGDDLDRQISLPLPYLKMNILPKLLHHFLTVPVLLNNKTIIWNKRKPWLKMAKLQMLVKQGGLVVPNIRLYQLAAQLHYVAEWINKVPKSVWPDPESFNAGNALSSILFALDVKKIQVDMHNDIIIRPNPWTWKVSLHWLLYTAK